jgi:hypothetical protein
MRGDGNGWVISQSGQRLLGPACRCGSAATQISGVLEQAGEPSRDMVEGHAKPFNDCVELGGVVWRL